MIKKVFIIFTFVLIIFSIAKVEKASTINSKEEIKVASTLSRGRLPGLVVVVRDGYSRKVENIKVLVKQIGGTYEFEGETSKNGTIYIDNLEANTEYSVQVIDVPDIYYMNNEVYTVTIGTMTERYHSQNIKIERKKGDVILKCNVPNANFWLRFQDALCSYTTDANGEIIIKNAEAGTCIITPNPIEGYEVEEARTIEIIGETENVVEFHATKINNESDETEKNEDTTDTEEENQNNVLSEEELAKRHELIQKLTEVVRKELYGEIKEEKPDSEEIKQENTEQEEIKQENTEQEEIKQENTEQEETKQENTEQEEIKQENTEQEEIKQESTEQEEIKQENTEQEEIKQESTEQEEIKQESTEQEEIKQENTEQEESTSDTEKDKMLVEQYTQIKNNTPKLPRTGNDYFEVKLIIFNSVLFIILMQIINKKTDKNVCHIGKTIK